MLVHALPSLPLNASAMTIGDGVMAIDPQKIDPKSSQEKQEKRNVDTTRKRRKASRHPQLSTPPFPPAPGEVQRPEVFGAGLALHPVHRHADVAVSL